MYLTALTPFLPHYISESRFAPVSGDAGMGVEFKGLYSMGDEMYYLFFGCLKGCLQLIRPYKFCIFRLIKLDQPH